jgi:hydroxymethylglutaryl-CoA reductase (NADPH)
MKAIERELKLDLSNIGSFTLDEGVASTRNNENMIGAAQVPIGIAGPIKINGSNFKNEFYIPLATTEGALVASINRGAKANFTDHRSSLHIRFQRKMELIQK